MGLIILSIQCQPRAENTNPLDAVRERLNQGQYAEAIQELESYRKIHPTDDEARYLLATAYTGSTGVNLIDAYSFFSKILIKEPRSQKTSSIVTKEEASRPDVPPSEVSSLEIKAPLTESQQFQAIGTSFHTYVGTLARNSDLFFAIPYVGSEQRSFVVESIVILRSIEGNSPWAIKARTYRGFLNLLQFVNYSKDVFPEFDANEDRSPFDLLCGVKAEVAFPLLEHSQVYLDDLITDLDWIAGEKSGQIAKRMYSLRDDAAAFRRSIDPQSLDESRRDALLQYLTGASCL